MEVTFQQFPIELNPAISHVFDKVIIRKGGVLTACDNVTAYATQGGSYRQHTRSRSASANNGGGGGPSFDKFGCAGGGGGGYGTSGADAADNIWHDPVKRGAGGNTYRTAELSTLFPGFGGIVCWGVVIGIYS